MSFHAVINCERKALTQAAVVSKKLWREHQRSWPIDRHPPEANRGSNSPSRCLTLVKAISCNQVFPRLRQDFDPHEVRRRMSALAVSQSMNFDFPDSITRSRSRSSFSCQAGDSRASAFDDKLCQSASIVWSFSSTLSFGMAVRISSTVLTLKV